MLNETQIRLATERQRELVRLAMATPERQLRDEVAVVAALGAGILMLAMWGLWAVVYAIAVAWATWRLAAMRSERRRRQELMRFAQSLDSSESVADVRTRLLHVATEGAR